VLILTHRNAQQEIDMATYNSIQDARTELVNSGVIEMFDYEMLDEVIEWMYRNDATPLEAASHFNAL